MFKNVEELKSFIVWCKKNHVKSFKEGTSGFELSEMAFIEQLNEQQMEEKVSSAYDETLIDTAKQELEDEDEELLHWSSN